MKKNRKALILCLAVPLAVGAVSGLLTRNSMETFQQLNKPPFSPPGWLFPVVWTVLFLLMGFASYLIWIAEPSEQRTDSLQLYAIQLAVNFVWPLLFFGGGWYFLAFAWLAFLWYLVFETIRGFGKIAPAAAKLMTPYLLWLTFAAYLNLAIAVLA